MLVWKLHPWGRSPCISPMGLMEMFTIARLGLWCDEIEEASLGLEDIREKGRALETHTVLHNSKQMFLSTPLYCVPTTCLVLFLMLGTQQ